MEVRKQCPILIHQVVQGSSLPPTFFEVNGRVLVDTLMIFMMIESKFGTLRLIDMG
jgi:hypothetical protein